MGDYEAFAALLRDHVRQRAWTASNLARLLGVHRSTTNRWLNGEKLPNPEIVQRLGDVLGVRGPSQQQFILAWSGVSTDPTPLTGAPPALAPLADLALRLPTRSAPPPPSPLPAGSAMPFRRNPLFVGRASCLRAIAAALRPPDATVALSGIGGLGKTQLAVEFAHRYGAFFPGGVFWLSMADPGTVAVRVAACGGPGGIHMSTAFDALPLSDQVRLVRATWQQPIPRLLIFDNCEEEALLDAWRPASGGCRVLLTTRRGRWSPALGVTLLPLAPLHRAESLLLLETLVADGHPVPPRLNKEIPGRATAPEPQRAQMEAIAAIVGDLPLALHLAGSYLARAVPLLAPSIYLEQLRANLLGHTSMQEGDFSPTHHLTSLERTLDLSYHRLSLADPVDGMARMLLIHAAWFAPGEPIPASLLLATIQQSTSDDETGDAALQRLIGLGLLEEPANGTLRVHRLLVAYVRRVSDNEGAAQAVRQTLLAEANRLLEAGMPAPMRVLQPHLHHAADHGDDTLTADLCAALGWHLAQLRELAAANHYIERALGIQQQRLDAQHPDVASTLNLLGLLCQFRSDYLGSYAYFVRAIAIWTHAYGPQHWHTATGYGNLGYSQMVRGDYAEARVNFERALAISAAHYGSGDPRTIRLVGNLGYLLLLQRDYAAAQPYLERALALRLELLGEQHPASVQSLNNLGDLYFAIQDYPAARACHERALAGRMALFGPDHISTLESLFKLAQLAEAEGDVATAMQLYANVLHAREQLVGPQHLEVAWAAEALGTLMARTGDDAGARPQLARALAIYQPLLRPDHATIARVQHALAALVNTPAPALPLPPSQT